MNRESRFDQLESQIVEALRRAPGSEPSAELDARIRARAHAALQPVRRQTQPRWMALAAGVVVLVGSGLALRIMQQVERAPGGVGAPLQRFPQTPATPPAADSELVEIVAAPADEADRNLKQAQTAATTSPMPYQTADKVSAKVPQTGADQASELEPMRRAPAEPFPAAKADTTTGPSLTAAPKATAPAPPAAMPVMVEPPAAAMEAPEVARTGGTEGYARDAPAAEAIPVPKPSPGAEPDAISIDRRADVAQQSKSAPAIIELKADDVEAREELGATRASSATDVASSTSATGVSAAPGSPGAGAADSEPNSRQRTEISAQ